LAALEFIGHQVEMRDKDVADRAVFERAWAMMGKLAS